MVAAVVAMAGEGAIVVDVVVVVAAAALALLTVHGLYCSSEGCSGSSEP